MVNSKGCFKANFFSPTHPPQPIINEWCLSAINFGLSGPGSSPSRAHCVEFLDKLLNSHGASLHPGVQMGTGLYNAGVGFVN